MWTWEGSDLAASSSVTFPSGTPSVQKVHIRLYRRIKLGENQGENEGENQGE